MTVVSFNSSQFSLETNSIQFNESVNVTKCVTYEHIWLSYKAENNSKINLNCIIRLNWILWSVLVQKTSHLWTGPILFLRSN